MLTDQDTLETGMLTEAVHRQTDDNAKATKRGAWSDTKLGVRYQRSLTQVFTKVVKGHADAYDPHKPGRNAVGTKLLFTAGLQPEVIAHLTIKGILNTLPILKNKEVKRVTLCMRIAETIHDEIRIRFFAQVKERRNLLKKLFAQFDKRTYPRHWRKRTILNYFHAEQIAWNQWSQREKLLVGYTLLVWFRDGTGLVDAPKSSPFVVPTEALVEHAMRELQTHASDYLLYKPMVVKPQPWSLSNLFRGGYISDRIKHYPLVKRTSKKDADEMMTRDWSQIIPAVNALQETPWRVNKTVLAALTWAYQKRGGGIAGLPQVNTLQLPPAPEGYGVDEEITKAHDRECFLVHSEEREMKGRRLAVGTVIRLAEQFKGFDPIYAPHNLDSRGRAYPLPAFLNPQGPDYVKGLLEFSRSEPIETEEHACWLAIAGANAYGNDKVSLQERVDWVNDNEEMILSIANDPYKDVRWLHVSEPFCFLRFCLEWKAFQEQGFGFMSHMVIPVDATCSGLQHYSMMLRDECGGRSTNLVPGLPRQDIYGDVAYRVIEKLMSTVGNTINIARNLVGIGITRKDTKRQVMVVPYSGTFSSCMGYTREALREKFKEKPCPWNRNDKEDDRAHVVMLAHLIWDSIDETVVKAKQAMNWLTKATRAYVKIVNKQEGDLRSKAMTWVTPDGFVVRHCQPDMKKYLLETALDGRVRLTLFEPTSRLSSTDMAQSIAPNFVHSLDATLMRMAIIKALALPKPIHSFGMIHDSFGVHANRMPDFLTKCIKPAFVEMYQGDPMADLRDRLLLTEGLELDPLPAKGSLDPNGVLESEFFFS